MRRAPKQPHVPLFRTLLRICTGAMHGAGPRSMSLPIVSRAFLNWNWRWRRFIHTPAHGADRRNYRRDRAPPLHFGRARPRIVTKLSQECDDACAALTATSGATGKRTSARMEWECPGSVLISRAFWRRVFFLRRAGAPLPNPMFLRHRTPGPPKTGQSRPKQTPRAPRVTAAASKRMRAVRMIAPCRSTRGTRSLLTAGRVRFMPRPTGRARRARSPRRAASRRRWPLYMRWLQR